jgi:hypothetical protein
MDGYKFDSKLEALRYEQLVFYQRVGDIEGFGVHPSFAICPGVRIELDFIVWDKQGRIWVEDTKGFFTDKSKVKAKMFQSKYPCFELRILTKEDV